MAQRFGKYQLLRRIAVGGMAEIFVARRQGLEGFHKTIVIKRIRPHLSENPTFVNMFLNEARLAAELTHSNIAQIYDLGRIGKSYFIAMEFINGRDMRAVVPQAEKLGIPFPMEYSLKVARDVCEGLYYAHRKCDEAGRPLNIVHRDVTPENIMVSFDGEVKILDFGIAKAENLVSETRAGEIKGKLGYLSPEQISGKAIDHRSDLFSLGVVLYEWITGHKLFTGTSDVEILRAVLEGRIYPPSYFRPEVPEAVEAILMRALERNREQRYQSAWDMLADIDQFLSSHTFVPSNIHLANFLQQIFADELMQPPPEDELREESAGAEAEESQRTLLVDTGRHQGRDSAPGRQDSFPTPREPSNPGSSREAQCLEVRLAPEQHRRLARLARLNGLGVDQLVAALLDSYLRFLPPGGDAPSREGE